MSLTYRELKLRVSQTANFTSAEGSYLAGTVCLEYLLLWTKS